MMNRLKIILIFCSAAILQCTAVIPQAPSAASNTQTPVASAAIADIIEKYRQEIPRRMQDQNVPGLAIAVVDDQNILWAEGFGTTGGDLPTPVTPSTLFSIQSMSKSFTATAAMFAAQDGLVDLDAPITNYLPNFHVNSIFEEHPEQKMTLRMLLSHTAGFAHEAPYGGNFDHPPYSFEEHIASISDTWLMFPVGTRYSYSNLGIDLAGYILQVRAGMPFTQYVQEKVLDPLGMKDSTLNVNRVRATSARAIGHHWIPLRPPVNSLLIPSGGVWTTAVDMARYLQFHINKGALDRTRLLMENLAETMYTPPNAPAGSYAQGITVTTRHGARRFQHGGGGFGFNSNMIWYPELKLGVVVLTGAEQPDLYYLLSEQVLDSIIDRNASFYAQRAENAVIVEPAYPPSLEGTVLSDYDLKALIASKALPADASAQKRREGCVGIYILTKWGIPVIKAEISETKGELVYTFPDETGLLIEAQPGLFFTPSGETFDARGAFPTALNLRLFKANPEALPFQTSFYAACGLIFMSTLFAWPGFAVIRRIRRKSTQAYPADVRAQRSIRLLWTEILAALASLLSLVCLVVVALIPDLVYVPWPRPYVDLAWWQFAGLSLPFASLLLTVVIAVFTGLAMKSRAWAPAARMYYILVVLALLAFNWILLS